MSEWPKKRLTNALLLLPFVLRVISRMPRGFCQLHTLCWTKLALPVHDLWHRHWVPRLHLLVISDINWWELSSEMREWFTLGHILTLGKYLQDGKVCHQGHKIIKIQIFLWQNSVIGLKFDNIAILNITILPILDLTFETHLSQKLTKLPFWGLAGLNLHPMIVLWQHCQWPYGHHNIRSVYKYQWMS